MEVRAKRGGLALVIDSEKVTDKVSDLAWAWRLTGPGCGHKWLLCCLRRSEEKVATWMRGGRKVPVSEEEEEKFKGHTTESPKERCHGSPLS